MSYKISVNITVRPAKRSIYINGISRIATRIQIRNAIEHVMGVYGELEDIRIPVNLETGRPLGYAFAIFKNTRDATNFMEYAQDGKCNNLRTVLNLNHMGMYDPHAHVTVSYAKEQY